MRSRIALPAVPAALVLLGAAMRVPVLLTYHGPFTAHGVDLAEMAHTETAQRDRAAAHTTSSAPAERTPSEYERASCEYQTRNGLTATSPAVIVAARALASSRPIQ